MNTLDTEKLDELLADGKYDEAKAVISSFFSQEMTKEEKASLYLQYASIYLKVMNKINQRYNAALQSIKKNLEEVTSYEKGAKDRLDIAEVRSSL